MSKKDKEVVQKLRNVGIDIIKQIDKGNDPSYELPVRTLNNVFLIRDSMEKSFLAGKISLSTGDYLCVPVIENKIELRMEGKGYHTVISHYR